MSATKDERRCPPRKRAIEGDPREHRAVSRSMTEIAAPARAAARPGLATWLCLAGVIVSWGGNWPFIKVAVAEVGPFAFTALRALGAAAVAAAILVASRRPLLPPPDERAPLAFIGLCQVALMLGLA